jgi:DNA-binding beta-propeller fold protein YncE
MKKQLFAFALVAAAAYSAEGMKVINKIKIGGTDRSWDYVTLDPVNRRLYVSHGTKVEIVDPDAGKVLGSIDQLHGVHGIAVAPDLNVGFITNGQSASVTIFDLKTMQRVGEPSTGGKNPDAVCYEPKTHRIFAVNHGGDDVTLIDAKTKEIVKTIKTGPGGEFCAVDGAGKIYVNLETSSELIEIDAEKAAVSRKMSLAPCEGPTGLSIDPKNKKLFPVCGNSMMAVVDIPTFKVIATPATGPGTDGGGFDSGLGYAYAANGGNGTMTIVKLVNGKYESVDQVPTERGARTMCVDEKTHHSYLLSADRGPIPEGKKQGPVLPETFHVLVVGK